MISRVIANLESIPVQLSNLIPIHVVLFVGGKVESLRDKKRRAEAVLQKQWSSDGEVGFGRVVERQYDDFFSRLSHGVRRRRRLFRRLRHEGRGCTDNSAPDQEQSDQQETRVENDRMTVWARFHGVSLPGCTSLVGIVQSAPIVKESSYPLTTSGSALSLFRKKQLTISSTIVESIVDQ